MGIVALALLLAAAGEPGIAIKAVPERGYTAEIETFDSATIGGVMERIKRAAAERCGAQGVRFGRHQFDTRVDTDRNVMLIENMKQNFICFDRASDPYKPVPADWKASAEDTAGASAFVTRFLDLLDRGDAAGIAMMDPLVELTQADWDGLHKAAMQHRTGSGGALKPQFRLWLNNPPDTTYPGAYAFFSVMDDHPGIEGTCGGILVHRVHASEYRIVQYDVQYISAALVEQQGLTPDELDGLCQR
ncbi:hypothetical protein [Sphingopyxis flava]|uniref:Uncharacterized protein n=1 Tax=Sphingopyxis flava TaxID=1507287 RepID=A0A1T4ZU77_9SPHN|nr:hypothetical protein [Sphingopyxis flava]SKB26311.1 hypothetical protein SAMN06295937_1001179 [Sphingopyxis flava]